MKKIPEPDPVAVWSDAYLKKLNIKANPKQRYIACLLAFGRCGDRYETESEKQANGICDRLREMGWQGKRVKAEEIFKVYCLGRRDKK